MDKGDTICRGGIGKADSVEGSNKKIRPSEENLWESDFYRSILFLACSRERDYFFPLLNQFLTARLLSSGTTFLTSSLSQ